MLKDFEHYCRHVYFLITKFTCTCILLVKSKLSNWERWSSASANLHCIHCLLYNLINIRLVTHPRNQLLVFCRGPINLFIKYFDNDLTLYVNITSKLFFRLNWENPDKFDPGRFLEAESVAPMTFLPFSYGPYMCIGHKFSMMEMKTVLSVLLRKFVFQPTPGFVYRKFQSAVLKPNPPAIIRIRIGN